MKEYLKITGMNKIDVKAGQATCLTFGDTRVYVESGRSLGCDEDLVMLWKPDSQVPSEKLLNINYRYDVTGKGYFCRNEKDGHVFYFCHEAIPDNAVQLGRQLERFVGYVSLIKKEIASHVSP